MADPAPHPRRVPLLWQWILLPFMLAMVFAGGYVFQQRVEPRLEARSTASRERDALLALLAPELASPAAVAGPAGDAPLRVAALLEMRLVEQRHERALYAMQYRTWTRYVSFLTGTLLVLIGATMIIARLREPATAIDAGADAWKASLRTSSPGIVLTALGAAIMIASVAVRTAIETEDRAIYLTPFAAAPSGGAPVFGGRLVPPEDLSPSARSSR